MVLVVQEGVVQSFNALVVRNEGTVLFRERYECLGLKNDCSAQCNKGKTCVKE